MMFQLRLFRLPMLAVLLMPALLISVLLIPGLFFPSVVMAKDNPLTVAPDAEKAVKKDPFGTYEKTALRLGLKRGKLTIDESPENKAIGKIHVINLDVFGKAEGFLRYVNFLHVTTRKNVISREVLLQPGDPWDEDLLLESIRRIKDPLFTSLVVIVPVKSSDPDKVDLLVVTRDVWSLRANSIFEFFQGTITALQLSIAENNIAGQRKHGAFVFVMDLGRISIGPQYIDKALFGTRFRLNTRVRGILSRSEGRFEGTSSRFTLDYPLWALRQKWGAGLSFSHFDAPVRVFRGTEVQLLDNPDTPEVEEIKRSYRDRRLSLQTNAVRSFGKKVKQQVTVGHQFSIIRPELVDDFFGSASDIEYLQSIAFPRSERASSLFLQYRLFTPDFVVYRNLNSFDLAEDVRLGPEVTGGLSMARKVIGSQRNFVKGNIGAAWTVDVAEDGFVRGAMGAETRRQNGEFIDNSFSTTLQFATPRVANTFRFVGRANLKVRLREQNNRFFLLGGDSGLRGYVISEFEGQKQLVTNLEIRSMPLKVGFTRVGMLAFWDMGHAADKIGDLRLKHGVGIGLRTLVPQFQPFVFRFDWAFPLESDNAGFPGRISAGVAQVF